MGQMPRMLPPGTATGEKCVLLFGHISHNDIFSLFHGKSDKSVRVDASAIIYPCKFVDDHVSR